VSKYLLIRIFFTLSLCCLPYTSQASSASSASITMTPVTYTDSGIVLFKVSRHIDYTGEASNLLYSYWWLVVSGSGIWEEVPYQTFQQPDNNVAEKNHEAFWNKLHQFVTIFNSDINWAQPPHSLLPLIKKYGFKPRPDFNKNEGQGTVTWSSKGICVNDKCSKLSIPQRTLGNKTSSVGYTTIEYKDKEIVRKDKKIVWVEVPPVPCIFSHGGVVLFKNGDIDIVDEKSGVSNTEQRGAEFDFNISEKNGEMIDDDYIDAISILPSELVTK